MECLITLLDEVAKKGGLQNVYFNKAGASWFFRVTHAVDPQRVCTFAVPRASKLQHAAFRECLLASVRTCKKTNFDKQVRAPASQACRHPAARVRVLRLLSLLSACCHALTCPACTRQSVRVNEHRPAVR